MIAASINEKKYSRPTFTIQDVDENDNSERLKLILVSGASERTVDDIRTVIDI